MALSKENKGYLFIVSGPSGAGKTVLCNEMIRIFKPEVVYSISTTSRRPRGGERNGQEYFFCSRKEFEKAIENNEFAEWALVHNNYYGTPKSFLQENLETGRHVILNIDVQGALKIKKQYPDAISIFILPPSLEVLEKRIRKRNMDSEEDLKHRMKNAKKELDFHDEYSYSITNDDLNIAINELKAIFSKYISATP